MLIADDHELVREAVRSLLEAIDNIEIVGEAADGIAAIALTKKLKPDVLVLDVAMPHAGGLAVIGEVTRWSPDTRVAVLTGVTATNVLVQLRDSGAMSLLSKTCSTEELDRGLRAIVAGREYVAEALRAAIAAGGAVGALTLRERQVLALAATGRSNAEIAELLVISAKTVDNHRTNIMRKLGVHSAAELVALALREGLLGT